MVDEVSLKRKRSTEDGPQRKTPTKKRKTPTKRPVTPKSYNSPVKTKPKPLATHARTPKSAKKDRLMWQRRTPKSARNKTPKSRIVSKTGPVLMTGVEDTGPRWPARALGFKTWDDEAFDHVKKTLVERGWKDMGTLCDPNNMKQLVDVVKCQKGHTLPRRCLWWVHEDDGRRLKDLPEEDMKTARHCISTFIGTDAAVTKVAITQMVNHEDFYPNAFILPGELPQLKKAMKGQRLWIAKPRNDYAGRGIVVYDREQEEFKELINGSDGKEFVVQTYIENPLLLGGFKFHFRIYTILTGVGDNFEAWIYKDGHGLFATQPFSNDPSTLGNNFKEYVHLTNWSINFVKKNEDLRKNKPVIGVGCEWTVANTLKLIKKHYPAFEPKKFWEDMQRICAVTMYKIAQWKNVKRNMKENNKHPRFENFGMDLMMDENFKIWLLEGNTEVGLNPVYENFPDERCTNKRCLEQQANGCPECRAGKNVRSKSNNKIITDVINFTLDLMQLDCSKDTVTKNKKLIPLHPLIAK